MAYSAYCLTIFTWQIHLLCAHTVYYLNAYEHKNFIITRARCYCQGIAQAHHRVHLVKIIKVETLIEFTTGNLALPELQYMSTCNLLYSASRGSYYFSLFTTMPCRFKPGLWLLGSPWHLVQSLPNFIEWFTSSRTLLPTKQWVSVCRNSSLSLCVCVQPPCLTLHRSVKNFPYEILILAH